ncbi:hypothetical protein Pelo_17752 [Pelomyxa schiedti]|nr:hypothetical protein Pelo_17752 [Pelomyxa schiedti]
MPKYGTGKGAGYRAQRLIWRHTHEGLHKMGCTYQWHFGVSEKALKKFYKVVWPVAVEECQLNTESLGKRWCGLGLRTRTPKPSTIFAGMRFVLTGDLGCDHDKLAVMIRSNGGECVSELPTHVICSKESFYSRARATADSLAYWRHGNLPILSAKWLHKSVKSGRRMPVRDWMLKPCPTTWASLPSALAICIPYGGLKEENVPCDRFVPGWKQRGFYIFEEGSTLFQFVICISVSRRYHVVQLLAKPGSSHFQLWHRATWDLEEKGDTWLQLPQARKVAISQFMTMFFDLTGATWCERGTYPSDSCIMLLQQFPSEISSWLTPCNHNNS